MSSNVSPDTLALELANVKGLLEGLVDSIGEVRKGMERVVSLDRTIAEQAVRYENLQKATNELNHAIRSCETNQRLQTDMLFKKIDELRIDHNKTTKEFDAFVNKTEGIIRTLKLFSGSVTLLLCVCATWVYDRAEGNRNMNLQQDYVLQTQQRELDDLRTRIPK